MACVALVSISQILVKILESDPYFFPCAKEKVECFREGVASLLAFLDKYPPICGGRVYDLRKEVRNSAYEADYVLKANDQFLQKYGTDNHEQLKTFSRSLERMMEDITSLGKEVKYFRHSQDDVHVRRLLDLDNLSMTYGALRSISYYSVHNLGFDSCFFPCTEERIKSFGETIVFLMDFIGKCPPVGTQNANSLIKQIKNLAFDALDIFQSLESRSMFGRDDNSIKVDVFPCPKVEVTIPSRLEKVMEAIELIKKEVKKINHDGKGVQGQRLSTDTNSSRPALRGYNTEMVALDKDLEMKLMEQLVGVPSEVCVIPIVGMGGIGKTTLARILFDKQLIKESFDIRGWGTLSQTYGAQVAVVGILQDIGVPSDREMDVEQLLYQTLYGRKYLIVLDDVWDTQAWDDIKRAFPSDNNGSRILLTTRFSQVAAYANCSSFYHEMQLLNEESSWSLLCREIFLPNSFPPELVELGKKIARQCQGLPLAISSIGGLLKKEKHTEEYWKYVSENVSSVLETTDDPILEVLTLSYNYLPYHLKACFLYFGSFKNHALDVSEVLKLWIAEGFVKPQIRTEMEESAKTHLRSLTDRKYGKPRIWNEMEDVAKEYMRYFIERNIVFVHKYDLFGNPKICGIHDLYRDICIREAKKETFYCSLNGNEVDVLDMNSLRRLTLAPHILADDESPSCNTVPRNDPNHPSPTIILKISSIKGGGTKFPVEILQLVNLKYLQLGHVKEIPSSISSLRKLQTLIVSSICIKYLPPEIWELQELKHILIPGFLLPDIPHVQGKGRESSYYRGISDKYFWGITDFADRRPLLTLSEVIDFKCTQEVLKSLPNLEKLNIVYKGSFYYPTNVSNLHQLQSLRCDFQFWSDDNIWQKLIFSFSLKKLVLIGCRIPWEQMTIVGALPNLEVLKLKVWATRGKLWETNDGEFKRLRFLLIRNSGLMEWKTEKEHFPRLQHLVLQLCNDFHAFPCEIGDIPTLKRIELHKCSHALEVSVKENLGEDSDINLTISSF